MKIRVISAVLLAFWSAGCSKKSQLENFEPVLVRALTDISVLKNGSITLGMEHVEAYDDNGDPMSLIVREGVNYTVKGTTLFPAVDFVGDLKVPVQVSDGSLVSAVDTMTVSVVDQLNLMPLIVGAWWEFDDVDYIDNSTKTSRLEITGTETVTVGGSAKNAFLVEWINLKNEYGIVYLMGEELSGTVSYGAYAPADTFIQQQELYRFPVSKGDSWPYTPVFFDATASEFYEDVPSTMTCTDTSVYLTVPAGVFNCIEYTYMRTVKYTRSGKTAVGITGSMVTSRQPRAIETALLTEKIYYAPEVGFISNRVYSGSTLLWKKDLRAYSVEETKGN